MLFLHPPFDPCRASVTQEVLSRRGQGTGLQPALGGVGVLTRGPFDPKPWLLTRIYVVLKMNALSHPVGNQQESNKQNVNECASSKVLPHEKSKKYKFKL